ncbi:hypothetical protein KV605_07500 [Rhodococcus opacus]|nr:hypothetical protein [Rhodococcus opacus]
MDISRGVWESNNSRTLQVEAPMHDLLHRSPLVARDVCTIRHPHQSHTTLALDASTCSSSEPN